MRYFLNHNASRPLSLGGASFDFEPIALRGGSWLGVLALEDNDPRVSILAAAHPWQASEISEARYDELKKKIPSRTGKSGSPQRPDLRLHPVDVQAASKNTDPTSSKAGVEANAESAPDYGDTSEELKLTDESPPFEPITDSEPKRIRKRKSTSDTPKE